ncbi:MAG: 4Fe-4S binding protein [Lachnospiraceae bacterium]|jgi:nitroreductase/NAD-dependent dihydropyrimidine dehydrogenase PreA subunit|nr:4Fe-4S binding protein [Lachnospiraceae bacterium]
MIQIDQEKCIGCGKCASDCFPRDIVITDQKAVPKSKNCIECGHCIAVCPTNAVTLLNYDMEEVSDCRAEDSYIDPAVYLNHLKSRRSIRQFQKTPVTKEQIHMILEAGRFSPTGSNAQNVSYFISQKGLDDFKSNIFDELKVISEEAIRTGNIVSSYVYQWPKMHEEFKKDGVDRLFFGANTVIVISSASPQSACLAAAHMETMIYSLGLGMLYSGFSTRAINHSPELQTYINLKDGYQVYAVLVIGHPDVEYLRTVPRKSADVTWD